MTGVSAPTPPDVPPTVGPFTVVEVRQARIDGQLVVAQDLRGRPVDLVLLTGGPSNDPAARDRFVAAAEAMHRQDGSSVLGASPAGSRAWVALPPGAGPANWQALLDAAGPPQPGSTRRGPGFDPYWRGLGSRVGWQEGLEYWGGEPLPAPWWRRWWVIALLLSLLTLLLLLLLSQCGSAIRPLPSDSSGPASSSGQTTSPSGSPTSSSPTQSPTTSSPANGEEGRSGTGSPAPTNSL